ncbi:MAG TPA: glycosyltransferase [Rhabdochlamydiaceae bacterium]|nr:glycosyltransferase [Rhabdochlamydiaceae bacterium]
MLRDSLFFLLICFPIFCFSETSDFELLMGKETELWQYVQTPEDQKRIDFFKKNFNQHISSLQLKTLKGKIPEVLHFIWLGPKDFPISSLEKIEKWIELHPNWTIKFWTDINRAPPLKKMKKQLVEDFAFQFLSDAYDQSDNFGEKAKILCYEILYQEGGVYIDHDVKPCSTLAPFNNALDFYCGLEKLGPSILSSSVYAATHLIAAKQGHPIMNEALVWLKDNWKKLEEAYPGQSKSAVKNRFAHRTLWALNEGIDRKIGMEDSQRADIVFPSTYFSLARRGASTIALHAHEGTWTRDDNDFETKMSGHIEEILSKNNESLKIVLLLSLGVLLSLTILFSFARTMRKSYEI